MYQMFCCIALSTANYDSILINWSNLTTLQSNVPFDGGYSQYTPGGDAEYARNTVLKGIYKWKIKDGGPTS